MYNKFQNKYKICVKTAAVTRCGQMIKLYKSTKYINIVRIKIYINYFKGAP